jgi:hypothetical protein
VDGETSSSPVQYSRLVPQGGTRRYAPAKSQSLASVLLSTSTVADVSMDFLRIVSMLATASTGALSTRVIGQAVLLPQMSLLNIVGLVDADPCVEPLKLIAGGLPVVPPWGTLVVYFVKLRTFCQTEV